MPYSNVASSIKRVLEFFADSGIHPQKLKKIKKDFAALLLKGKGFFSSNQESDLFTIYSSKQLIPGLKKEIDSILKGLEKDRISEAIWSYYKYKIPERKIYRKYPINRRDWSEIKNCIAEIGFDEVKFNQLVSSIWHDKFEEDYMGCDIIFDEKALDDLLISAIEGYLSPRRRSKKPYEVFGVCLGTTTQVEDQLFYEEIIHVTKCPPQISAEGDNQSCLPKDQSYESLNKVQKYLFPQYKIVGEYHSHPYKDLNELKQCKGWENSKQDERRWAWCKSNGNYGDLQFALIVGISKLQRTNSLGITAQQANHLFFNLEDLKIHLFVKRILKTGTTTDRNIRIIFSKMIV